VLLDGPSAWRRRFLGTGLLATGQPAARHDVSATWPRAVMTWAAWTSACEVCPHLVQVNLARHRLAASVCPQAMHSLDESFGSTFQTLRAASSAFTQIQ
jgi:hypothetical protein